MGAERFKSTACQRLPARRPAQRAPRSGGRSSASRARGGRPSWRSGARSDPVRGEVAPQVVQCQRPSIRSHGIYPDSARNRPDFPRIPARVAAHSRNEALGISSDPGSSSLPTSARLQQRILKAGGEFLTVGSDDATRGRSRHKRLPLRQANHPCPLPDAAVRHRAVGDQAPAWERRRVPHGGYPACQRLIRGAIGDRRRACVWHSRSRGMVSNS